MASVAATRLLGAELSTKRPALLAVGTAALLVLALVLFLLRPVRVEGPSMSPTLVDGDVVLVWIGPGVARWANRGAIVVVDVPATSGMGHDLAIKRVVTVTGVGDERRWHLEGDNAAESRDSRSYGDLRAERLRGVVLVRLSPSPGRLSR